MHDTRVDMQCMFTCTYMYMYRYVPWSRGGFPSGFDARSVAVESPFQFATRGVYLSWGTHLSHPKFRTLLYLYLPQQLSAAVTRSIDQSVIIYISRISFVDPLYLHMSVGVCTYIGILAIDRNRDEDET